jgi:transcriptional regulator with XRE-family HTH domain
MTAMETIGQRIRRLRKERGIGKQIDLAEPCGMTQSTLSDIESKDQEFSAKTLMLLAKKLDVSIDEIMYGSQGEIVGQAELIRIFAELSQEQRNNVLVMVRALHTASKPNIKAA